MGIKRESKRSASATSPCADLRAVYHNCFNRWYSEKFVKGQFDEEPCVSEWQKYRACLSEHLEDKKLKRFLEEETIVHSSMKAETKTLIG
ncbi:uncharacterized protein At4g33100-like isoform X2 [Cucurbita pepo subsp. pepo]|uniref:uncharacterized protein At4g33100-like isoform X2 n=1 Tax=Cucurbita pepo subsp. pepo TaxID=3664 RepID=UPI000C9D9129|nr:uncharacterized protein At4g33100-like isoform X2 [Cucurbita pepo subsp. pepo]